MKLQLRILDGARAGVTGVFSGAEIALGRHPSCQLAFDPDADLAVSARHAVIVRDGGRWLVRDLGSRNGTLVNGHPIRSVTRLDDTDQIRLGADGPTLEVRLVPDATPDAAPPAPADGPRTPRATDGGATAPPRHGSSTTQRIRVEVGRQTRRLRVLSGVLLAALAGTGGYLVWQRRAGDAERERERAAMQARIDSILVASEEALGRLRGEVDGLAEALRTSREEIARLQSDLRRAEASGSSDEAQRLRAELAEAALAVGMQQAAALVDYRAIHEANYRAVAMVWAEFAPGDVQTGTAFAVRPDGILVTNRHVLRGPDGTRQPRRLAVQFTHSGQVWRATFLGASAQADLAALRVDGVRGEVPTIPIPDLPPPVNPGDPVATIGFPFGTALPMRAVGEGGLIRATLTAGTVSKVLPDLVQIDGYGAQGASGSPVFERDGRLVGALYGGEPGSEGRIVYVVPVAAITSLLGDLGLSSGR